MVRNFRDGNNEEAFWMRFREIYSKKALDDKLLSDKFYRCEFQGARDLCGYNPKAGEVVRRISKPNPEYYREIMNRLSTKPEETLMVGNDVEEDMEDEMAAGMNVFLLTDCLLNREHRDIN